MLLEGSVIVETIFGLPGLGAIYHSPLCGDETKELIKGELLQQKALEPDEEPPKPHISVPPKTVDLQKFNKAMEEHLESYSALAEE